MDEDRELAALAAAYGLAAPVAEYLEGVRLNLDLLRQYGALVEGAGLSDRLEPAFEYTP